MTCRGQREGSLGTRPDAKVYSEWESFDNLLGLALERIGLGWDRTENGEIALDSRLHIKLHRFEKIGPCLFSRPTLRGHIHLEAESAVSRSLFEDNPGEMEFCRPHHPLSVGSVTHPVNKKGPGSSDPGPFFIPATATSPTPSPGQAYIPRYLPANSSRY